MRISKNRIGSLSFPQLAGDICHSHEPVRICNVGISTNCAYAGSPGTGGTGAMLYKTLSAAVYGIDANIIQVEVDCSGIKCDQDHFHTFGLPDAAVRESRDRVRAG